MSEVPVPAQPLPHRQPSSWQHALLGVVVGLLSALFIVAFHQLIRFGCLLWGADDVDNFEQLPAWAQFSLPLAGALVLGLIFHWLPGDWRQVGVVHVIQRVHNGRSRMPLSNTLVQFFGGAMALATGQSSGSEGPAIHLGASSGNWVMRELRLPEASGRMLIGAGAAAAIAASYNTPLAGVVFAMEVILLDYSAIGFVPIVLATVSATAVTQALLEVEPFALPSGTLSNLWELVAVIALGLIAGCSGALFIQILKQSLKLRRYPSWITFTLAGTLTGSLALLIPEVLGLGYDSLMATLGGELLLPTLLLLAAAKLLATAFGVGVGLPIGLIAPNLLTGACLGAALGSLVTTLWPELDTPIAFYALIGMAATMSAVLNAPLAALVALLELTGTPHILFPGLLAVTLAHLICRDGFGQLSAHQTVFQTLNQPVQADAFSVLLASHSVFSAMQPAPQLNSSAIPPDGTAPEQEICWLQQGHYCVARADQLGDPLTSPASAEHYAIATVDAQATLREAAALLEHHPRLLVLGAGPAGTQVPVGLISQREIRHALRRHSLMH